MTIVNFEHVIVGWDKIFKVNENASLTIFLEKNFVKNPFPSTFQIHYKKDLLHTRITLRNQIRIQIPKVSKAIYTPWNEIGLAIERVPRETMNRLYCICIRL